MFKSFYKTLFMFLFLFLTSALLNEEKAYAAEFIVSDSVENSMESLQTNDQFVKFDSAITEALATAIPLDDTSALFCTSDTPDNIVEFDTPTLCNTDGSVSYGYSYVYCTKADTKYTFGCSVSIHKLDSKPKVSIEQI